MRSAVLQGLGPEEERAEQRSEPRRVHARALVRRSEAAQEGRDRLELGPAGRRQAIYNLANELEALFVVPKLCREGHEGNKEQDEQVTNRRRRAAGRSCLR